ncbi:cAMP-dependent protein kinase regulator [Nematocida homosporus]|uniref:cAMP-dependent protein kinase regulator n=1 Tax=Nematocida homosporus TaxID=1912981 RepID=UPI002220EF1D|nr:cAMP-dependent protein kinase regulator [Nematocida homosporus]KAI5186319.1 cAMP-dependent protein kinase regulator [Nematocida homosporus]
MATDVFARAVAIISGYLGKRGAEIENPLKFAYDVLALYLINSENENVEGLSEDLLVRAAEEVLEVEEELMSNEQDMFSSAEAIPLLDHPDQSHRKRRGSVCASADPFAPLLEYPKSTELFEFLLSILWRSRVISRTMNPDQMKKLVSTMYLEEISEHFQLITQGDYGKTMYLIESGTFQVIQNGEVVSVLAAESLFGEISLLYSFPRTATVVCTSPAKVWVVNADSYTAILMADQRKSRERICQVLERNSNYTHLTVAEKDKVLRCTHLMNFSPNETLDVAETGVFMLINPESTTIQSAAGTETVLSSGDIIAKGSICREYLSLLFIPDIIYPFLGLVSYLG